MSAPLLVSPREIPCFLGRRFSTHPEPLGSWLLFCLGSPSFYGPCRTAKTPQTRVHLTLPNRHSGNYCAGE